MGLEWVNDYFFGRKNWLCPTSKQNNTYKMRTVPDANILVHSAYASHYSRHLPCVTLVNLRNNFIYLYFSFNKFEAQRKYISCQSKCQSEIWTPHWFFCTNRMSKEKHVKNTKLNNNFPDITNSCWTTRTNKHYDKQMGGLGDLFLRYSVLVHLS